MFFSVQGLGLKIQARTADLSDGLVEVLLFSFCQEKWLFSVFKALVLPAPWCLSKD